jgi:cell division protein FtsB
LSKKKEIHPVSLWKKLFLIFLGFLFVVLLIVSFFGKKGLLEIYQAQKRHEALLQEKESLKIELSKLMRDIEELKLNPRAIEKKAREKLWLMHPDEIVIIKEQK